MGTAEMGHLNQGGREEASGRGGGRFQEDVEVVGVDGAELRVFAIDLIGVDQVDQGFFEGERPFLLGEGNFLMEVLESVFADVVASAVADHQEFSGGNAASAFSRGAGVSMHSSSTMAMSEPNAS